MYTARHLTFPLGLQHDSGLVFNDIYKHHSKDITNSYFEVETSARSCTHTKTKKKR